LKLVLGVPRSKENMAIINGSTSVSGHLVSIGGGSGGALPSIVQPTAGNPLAATCAQFTAATNTCAYPVNLTAGNTAYVLITAGTAGTVGVPTCSGTATVGTFTAVGAGSTAGGAQQWYKAAITGSGSCTVSETYSASTNVGVFPFEVSNDGGVDGSPVYSLTSCFSTTGCTLASFTPGTTSDLVLTAVMSGATTVTYSSLTPYTLVGQGAGSTGNETSFF
jgi:hypothetical protein